MDGNHSRLTQGYIMEINEIANLTFYSSDLSKQITIKEYLKTLLLTLWEEGEGFSGKRPLGNSGWEYDLFVPLIGAKLIKGSMDPQGYIDEVDESAANKIIKQVIESL